MDTLQVAPQIDVWYGKEQSFGMCGQPQRWVNILGRVLGARPIKSLHYSLNGSPPVKLSIGPDQRRLSGKGDFNIDLDIRHLIRGINTVHITAEDESGGKTVETVRLNYGTQTCPLPYRIDWSQVARIQDVAHVIDGRWSINNGRISPDEIGYDRLIAIGDMAWRDYEVTVPITVHGINAGCYNYPSVHAGVGVVMRWKGHSNWGMDAWASGQPYFGPSPYGAIGWYCVFYEGPELNFFDPDFNRPVRQPCKLALHNPYIFKVQVKTLVDGQSQYRLKVWEVGASETADWILTTTGTRMSLTEGALVLGAHHVAASFGNVSVCPV